MTLHFLPVDTGDKPLKLVWRQRPGHVIRSGPDEVTFMKTTSAEPDTVPVPAQDLEAGSRFVGKDEGGALVPRCVECLLNVLRQGVDAAAHINGFDRQEQVLKLQHI